MSTLRLATRQGLPLGKAEWYRSKMNAHNPDFFYPRAVALACLFLCSFLAFAAPGDLVEYKLERSMSVAEINSFISQLYEGYSAPRARYTVDIYAVKFESTYADGSLAVAYAQVFIPRFGNEAAEIRALYAFGPGSTGILDACRPSREHVVGTRWGLYRQHVLSHAGQGMLAVIPDYLGFGDTNCHQQYLLADAEAAVMLDAIRATKKVAVETAAAGINDTRNFVAGFSQGGHAAYAAADQRASYAPEISLAGVIGYGPSTNLFVLFEEYPSVVPMALYTLRNHYGADRFDPDQILAAGYAATLDADVTRQCVGGMQAYFPGDPRKLYNKEFADALLANRLPELYPEIYTILRANSTGLTDHGVPSLILQGTDDIVVSMEAQRNFVQKLEFNENPVELVIYNARHDTRQISFTKVQEWMRSKLN